MAGTNGLISNTTWYDARNGVVVRKPYAAPLSTIEFALFRELFRSKETLTSAALVERIYNGTTGGDQVSPLHVAKRGANKKLKPLRLEIVTMLRKGKALWRLHRA